MAEGLLVVVAREAASGAEAMGAAATAVVAVERVVALEVAVPRGGAAPGADLAGLLAGGTAEAALAGTDLPRK